MSFKDVINNSKAVSRFAYVQNLTHDEVYNLYFESFCSYIEMFRERLKYGRNLQKVIAAYRGIDAFRGNSAREIVEAMFKSKHMHLWFAYRFLAAIDKQLMEQHTSASELMLALTFSKDIPTKQNMEDILNEANNIRKQKGRKSGIERRKKTTAGAA